MGQVANHIAAVEEKITAACQRSGRKREDVLLLAVSKTKPVSMIQEAVACGLRDLGENKVLEIMDKYEPLKFNANRLSYIIEKLVMQNEHTLEVRKRMLDGLNPKRILERGYAKVEQGGVAVNDAKSVLENMPLEVNFYDGQVTTSVTKKTIFERK